MLNDFYECIARNNFNTNADLVSYYCLLDAY